MTYSYTQISHYLTCPRRYRHRYLDGWQEKDTRASLLFGRVFEKALAANCSASSLCNFRHCPHPRSAACLVRVSFFFLGTNPPPRWHYTTVNMRHAEP